MEYALYKGLRTAAQPTLKGICEHCGMEVIAKCGSKKIWHWAHSTLEHCDGWYKTETNWHREWKHIFGKEYSEIRIKKENSWHIADVVNKDGIVFEFQNSSISSDMITAREMFYGERMIWVINGESFNDSFIRYDAEFIKDWQLKIPDEFEMARHYTSFTAGIIIEDWRVKQEAIKDLLKQQDFTYIEEARLYYLSLKVMSDKKILEERLNRDINALYQKQKRIHNFIKGEFTWLRARRSWEDAKRAVFIDFGGDELYWVTTGMGKTHGTGMSLKKETFIEKYAASTS